MKLLISIFTAILCCVSTLPSQAQSRSIVFERGPIILNLEAHRPLAAPAKATPQFDTTLASRIYGALLATYNAAEPYDLHGVGFSILIPGQPQITGTIGLNDDVNPLDSSLHFEVGSITKTFTTALIMKLQEEGKLSIKDSIHKWLPAYPNIDTNITIQQLLSHSSGIFDYFNDDTNGTAANEQYGIDPSKHWTPQDILSYVGKPNFAPGKGYRYCNTGFVLLAMIAEKAGGASFRDQLHANFIDPLHLTHTYVGGYDSIPGLFAHNWFLYDSASFEDFYDIDKEAQLTGSFGDGNIVSTPGDLARWGAALYLGKAITETSVKAMISPLHNITGAGLYGLGTQEASYYSKKTYGHSGHLFGFTSAMFTNLVDSVTVVAYLNADGDPFINGISVNDYLVDMLNEIYLAPSSVIPINGVRVSTQAYPNPATNRVTIAFGLKQSDKVILRVYNPLGEEIQTVFDAWMSSGMHEAAIETQLLPTGSYFYTIQTSDGTQSGKFSVEH
ncbi:MAG TPA: serine hydrolase [Candidatus Kapabacteria bacterium]|jgi:CubicO group peptidase (beta-lactamase class C family)|nr:serine hydrolase [Candidatus Kapabacteria bacterium]